MLTCQTLSVYIDEKDDSTRQQTSNRRMAICRLSTRIPVYRHGSSHYAFKHWNAKPIDLACLAEVTEILFASSDLVSVPAKCLADESSLDESINTDATQTASGPVGGETRGVESESTVLNRSEEDAGRSLHATQGGWIFRTYVWGGGSG